ncbi:MAG: hypothetical protein M3071_18285 [Actinomycetota bacterium]|nr:hypothetical protein [Actinomycetota bacterium]
MRAELRWRAKAYVPVIQRQLGHSDLGITSTHLPGIDTSEVINAIHAR